MTSKIPTNLVQEEVRQFFCQKLRYPHLYDFYFILSDQPSWPRELCQVPCHKAYLVLRLPHIFNNYEKNSFELEDAVDRDIFINFVEYLYTNDFPGRETYSEHQVVELLKLAKRFCPEDEIPFISDLLVPQITINSRNVFHLQKIGNELIIPKLSEVTMCYLQSMSYNTQEFVKSSKFLELSKESLMEMLQCDELKIKEIDLFLAVIKWGENQASDGTLSDKIKDLVPLIRYPVMTHADFAQVSPFKLLSTQDIVLLFEYICGGKDTETLPVWAKSSTVPRDWPPPSSTEDSVAESLKENEDTDMMPISTTNSGSLSTLLLEEQDFEEQVDNDQFDEEEHENADTTIHCVEEEEQSISTNSVEEQEQQDNVNLHSTIIAKTWESFLAQASKLESSCQSIHGKVDDFQDFSKQKQNILNIPDLSSVFLDLYIPLGSTTTTTAKKLKILQEKQKKKVLELRRNFDLSHFWIFKNNKNVNTKVAIFSKMNFELFINGVKFFKVNNNEDNGELHWGCSLGRNQAGMFSPSRLSVWLSTFLMKENNNYRRLTLVDLELPSDIPITDKYLNVQELCIWGARVPPQSKIGDFLLHFPNLVKLISWTKCGIRDKDWVREKSSMNLESDLSLCGHKLEKIAISYGKIVLSSSSSLPKFYQLTELYTGLCHWSAVILDNFDEIFPNLQKVSFSLDNNKFEEVFSTTTSSSSSSSSSNAIILNDSDEDICNGPKRRQPESKVSKKKAKKEKKETQLLVSDVTTTLLNKLIKMPSINWIRLDYLVWSSIDDPEAVTQGEEDLYNFLFKEVGLLLGKKKHHPYNFLLEKKNGVDWTGVSYDDINDEPEDIIRYADQHSKQEYDLFEHERIFRDFEAFKKYDVPMANFNE